MSATDFKTAAEDAARITKRLRSLGLDPTVTYALQIGAEETRLPDHASLAEAMLRAVGEAQLGQTVTLLRVEVGPEPRRVSFTPLAEIGPVVS